jgi:hypothetical protein
VWFIGTVSGRKYVRVLMQELHTQLGYVKCDRGQAAKSGSRYKNERREAKNDAEKERNDGAE